VLKDLKVLQSLEFKVPKAFKVQLDFRDDKVPKDLRDLRVIKVLHQ
jgi:hypothetical protein